jgi:hypothetical protein
MNCLREIVIPDPPTVRCNMQSKIKLSNSSSQIEILLGQKPEHIFCNGTVLNAGGMRRQTPYVDSITVGAAEHGGGSEVESPRRFEVDDQLDPSRTAALEGRPEKSPAEERGQVGGSGSRALLMRATI